MQAAKTTDNKGRVTLGPAFANRNVLIEKVDDTEVRVTLARIIPEREAWLYENKDARKLVAKGLEQAGNGQFASLAPDIDSDTDLVNQIEDSD